MADLSVARDRAQIIVVSALALGVLFVALALILNSAIFTENFASRGDTTGVGDVAEYRDDLRRGVGTLLAAENRNGSDHAAINDSLGTAVGGLSRALTDRAARSGATSHATVVGATNGTLINQSDAARRFTDGTGDPDWTLATDLDRTRALRVTVNRSELDACSFGVDCFLLNVSDGTDSWQIEVRKDGSDEVVVEVDNGTAATCDPVDADTVEIDATGGTVGGEPCPVLSFGDAPDSNYEIGFEHGDAAGGTYSLVVDNASVAPFPWGGGSEPTATDALYNVTVGYDYRSSAVAFESRIRIAPGEHDA